MLWSKSCAKDFLTKYALGLFCKEFDRIDDYHVSRTNEREWFCMKKEYFDKNGKETIVPSFVRSRKITLDAEGFMNCSCGRTREYLMPCVHICAVVKEEKYFVPDVFHIRWAKEYSYFFGKDADSNNKEKSEKMHSIIKKTRLNNYKNGMYRGIDLSASSFLVDLGSYVMNEEEDEQSAYMKYIYEKSTSTGILRNSFSLETFITEKDFIASANVYEAGNSELQNFSLFTQEEFSDNRCISLELDSCLSLSAYEQTNQHYQDALKMAVTQNQIDELNLVLASFVHKQIAATGSHGDNKGKTLCYGENYSYSKSNAKRHKFLYERIMK